MVDQQFLRARQGSFLNEPSYRGLSLLCKSALNEKTKRIRNGDTYRIRRIKPKAYRETSGLYYEDFEVGDRYSNIVRKTIYGK